MTSNNRHDFATLLRQVSARLQVDSLRQTPGRSVNRVPPSADGDSDWQKESLADDIELASPQSALERMLSTLGMAGGFAEDER
jgi:hypothetical protein